jgi:putative transposase
VCAKEVNNMIRGFKVKLHPTKEQKILILKSFGTARWVYNWCLNRQIQNYKAGGKFIDGRKLRKEVTALKKQPEYKWLNEVSAKVCAQAALDLCDTFDKFFKKKSGYPKFKCKRNNSDSFFQREDNFVIKDNKVKIEKIGYVSLAEDIIPVGEGIKYYNPRVKYDGINIYLTVGVEVSENQANQDKTEPMGIDLGIKTLAVCSSGKKYKIPSIRKEIKRLKRFQRKASRNYQYMKSNNISYKQKSNRLKKLEKKILKTHHRIANILNNNIHQMTAELIKLNPSSIVIEDLNIKGMFKNKYLSEKLKYAKFADIIRQLKYKCDWNNIRLIEADRWYPSSKICSSCGYKKEKLSLSERVFVCEKCNTSIDRDYNAALNLKKLAI